MRRTTLALLPLTSLLLWIAPDECAACTVMLVHGGGEVLAGNNEDFAYPQTVFTALPAERGKHGVLFFGFDQSWQQGAVNDQGLFFDGLALPRAPQPSRNKAPPFRGSILEKAMRQCATVDQVVALFARYSHPLLENAQLMFGDRQGNSVIIERDRVLRGRGTFQLATNFRQSVASKPYTCPRYQIAHEMLAARPSRDLVRSVLAAVHNEGDFPTLYSNIYDLKRGKIYLYYFHNFQQEVVLDLRQELSKGRRTVRIASLFPRQHAAEVFTKRARAKLAAARRALEQKAVKLEHPEELLGKYALEPVQRDVTIGWRHKRLFLEERELGRLELYPTGRDRFGFLLMGHPCTLSVERDQRGKITGLSGTVLGEKLRGRRVGR